MCDVNLSFSGGVTRCRVKVLGRGMTMGALVEMVEEKSGEVGGLIVHLDGVRWEDMTATVEKARLFECKVTAGLT
ncbi:hypothetical protein TrRE_jg12778 [Triparma retinervis]|uniref:Uncharacterized protein n=1 Tax=Triparma retinervis TaxID=2557542 RepID=A0A9W6Z6F3_9STRA|nr:hypothetical protein TrRE_jg12778 [Triparma retinervis]